MGLLKSAVFAIAASNALLVGNFNRPDSQEGKETITATNAGVTVKLFTRKLMLSDSVAETWRGALGRPLGAGTLVIWNLVASRPNGQRIWIRRSSFADLANVVSLKVVPRGTNFDVVIRGGDASESYVAIIAIRGNYTASRIVRPGEASADWEEKTVYNNRPINYGGS